MTISDILEQVKQLEFDELDELTEQILDLRMHRKQQAHQPKTGAELVAMLKKMGPIDLVDPHIEDPVEWLEAQRQKEADRLEPYFTLDELLADITPDTLHGEISTGNPVGKEIW